ncbi:hypothetical protein B0H21DRAFT_93294 [Amylocystis lapponica]|nr:hypothetical protein B0H21DRAFT_93294 [Amylocystis lapponica]
MAAGGAVHASSVLLIVRMGTACGHRVRWFLVLDGAAVCILVADSAGLRAMIAVLMFSILSASETMCCPGGYVPNHPSLNSRALFGALVFAGPEHRVLVPMIRGGAQEVVFPFNQCHRATSIREPKASGTIPRMCYSLYFLVLITWAYTRPTSSARLVPPFRSHSPVPVLPFLLSTSRPRSLWAGKRYIWGNQPASYDHMTTAPSPLAHHCSSLFAISDSDACSPGDAGSE